MERLTREAEKAVEEAAARANETDADILTFNVLNQPQAEAAPQAPYEPPLNLPGIDENYQPPENPAVQNPATERPHDPRTPDVIQPPREAFPLISNDETVDVLIGEMRDITYEGQSPTTASTPPQPRTPHAPSNVTKTSPSFFRKIKSWFGQ